MKHHSRFWCRASRITPRKANDRFTSRFGKSLYTRTISKSNKVWPVLEHRMYIKRYDLSPLHGFSPLPLAILSKSNHLLSHSKILHPSVPTVPDQRDVASCRFDDVQCDSGICFLYLCTRSRLAFCRVHDTRWTGIHLSIWLHDRPRDPRGGHKLSLARTADDGQLRRVPKRSRR